MEWGRGVGWVCGSGGEGVNEGARREGKREERGFRRKKTKLTERRQACPKRPPSVAPVAEQRVEPYPREHPELREEDQVRDDDGDLAREARRDERHWKFGKFRQSKIESFFPCRVPRESCARASELEGSLVLMCTEIRDEEGPRERELSFFSGKREN